MKDRLASLVEDKDVILYAFALVAVGVLVGLGKVKAETLEMMIMALIGRLSVSGKNKDKSTEE